MTGRPLPVPDADTHALWSGLREGELRLRRCRACERTHFYQQDFCRDCGALDLDVLIATGRGTVHTFSVVHRPSDPAFADETPYAVLLVELEEGPRMITRIIAEDLERVRIGLPVELIVVEVEGVALPYFRAAG